MVDQRIREVSRKLDRKARSVHSNSMGMRYGYDYSFLASLVEDAKMSGVKVREDFISKIPDDLYYNVCDYIDDLDELSKRVIEMYKNIDFYCFLRHGNTSISNKDMSLILKEFLLKKMPWMYEIYRDLYNKGHIFFADCSEDYGAAYLMPLVDEYFISLNRCSANDLSYIETTIHEIMHIYVARLAYSYSWNNHANIIKGFSKETASIYSSLSFFEFCLENHICKDDALLHRNVEDYEILTLFKLIHYFYSMAVTREKEVNIYDGIDFEFLEKYKMEEDEGIPFFQYHEEDYYKESFNKFLYATGAVEAYELLRLEKEGYDPKKIINDFVLKYQREEIDSGLFDMDLSFMAKEIKEHQKNLEKKYPICGYSVLK